MKLKKSEIKKCSTCNGIGYLWVDGQGAYGEPDYYERACTHCKGYGFLMSVRVVRKFKEVAGCE